MKTLKVLLTFIFLTGLVMTDLSGQKPVRDVVQAPMGRKGNHL